MKLWAVMALMAFSVSANAASLKSLVCENLDFKVNVEVLEEKNEAAVVAWSVENKATEDSEKFMGLLFSADGKLNQFSSSDQGSEIEITGKTAKLTLEDYSTVLNCK